MTVSSLWSVLDEAGCGTPVGFSEFVGGSVESSPEPKSLAVDLSIWICEALTSSALSTFHADPAAHLVYHRALKLLKLGLNLVFVVEGKRRMRGGGAANQELKNRRSGTAFWRACRSCEQVLKNLGVPVARASAEGEALCALLNQRGIVDGVVSNDGDCLLFGAKVVYTMFTVDNLERSQVIKYEATKLRALLKEGEDEFGDSESDNDSVCVPLSCRQTATRETLPLSREDLIAYGLLTGSDLVGAGVPHVGSKKAIRFIRLCQQSRPLSASTAALEELKSWSNAAAVVAKQDVELANFKAKERCCTLCLHPGDKRSHEKNGCEECGTSPGEPCFAVTSEGKFRRALRSKALQMSPPFASADIIDLYYHPNGDEVPLFAAESNGTSILQARPSFRSSIESSVIVKGQILEGSREYVRQTLPKLQARLHIFSMYRRAMKFPMNKYNKYLRQPFESQEVPTAKRITKRVTHQQQPCYEVQWSLENVDFCTNEWQSVIDITHPALVDQFRKEEARAMQGVVADQRRKVFLGPNPKNPNKNGRGNAGRRDSRRRAHHDAATKGKQQRRGKRRRIFNENGEKNVRGTADADAPKKASDDFASLVRFMPGAQTKEHDEYSSLEDFDSAESDFSDSSLSDEDGGQEYLEADAGRWKGHDEKVGAGGCKFPSLSPRNRVISCDMGLQIEVTPIVKRRRRGVSEGNIFSPQSIGVDSQDYASWDG